MPVRCGGSLLLGLLALAAALFAPPARAATVVYQESFDTGYVTGTNLGGQNGWTGGPLLVQTAAGLGSVGIDGRSEPQPGYRAFSTTDRPLAALDPAGVHTLGFDAYATNAAPRSHNAGFGFRHDAGGGSTMSVSWWMNSNSGATDWYFVAEYLIGGSNTQVLSGGFNTPVRLEIVLDPIAGQLYGRYDFADGLGLRETTHYAMTLAQFQSVNGLRVVQDYRGLPSSYTGANFDDILLVSSVPEPGVAVLLAAGLAAAGARRYRRSNR